MKFVKINTLNHVFTTKIVTNEIQITTIILLMDITVIKIK